MLATAAFALATVGGGLISFYQALFREGRPSTRRLKAKD